MAEHPLDQETGAFWAGQNHSSASEASYWLQTPAGPGDSSGQACGVDEVLVESSEQEIQPGIESDVLLEE